MLRLGRVISLALLVLLVAACSNQDAPNLEALGKKAKSAKYLVSASKALPSTFPAIVAQNGDVLEAFYPEAGFASVITNNPGAYKKYASTVVRNVRIQFIDPVERVALEPQVGNPPMSGANDPLFDLQWGHDAIDAPEAWNAGYRGKGARVAVLDSGFELEHPDLAGNINAELSRSFVDNEGLQYELIDGFSHGTHVAGTIAALDNEIGIIGVAPEAELVLVKVLSDLGSGTFEDVIEGIIYSADVGADVINMSLGGVIDKSGACEENPETGELDCYSAREAAALKNAIGHATTYAYQQGTLVIASAGNDARNLDKDRALVSLPSEAPHVISISATGPTGWALDPDMADRELNEPAFYTNYGKSVIDFAAPGGNVDFGILGSEPVCTIVITRPCWVFDLVFSTGSRIFVDDGDGIPEAGEFVPIYYWSAGTSMAAPHASGVAALIVGRNGGTMKAAQLTREMRQAADRFGKSGKDAFYGKGVVDAYNGDG